MREEKRKGERKYRKGRSRRREKETREGGEGERIGTEKWTDGGRQGELEP